MSVVLSEPEHRKVVAERRERSPLWQVIHALGSLRLALMLLFTIAVACAVATVAESNFSAKVAQVYIYKNPWFMVWLGLLCLNLACAALTRWPWQRKHVGFVVTHLGIITLLVGAMIGSVWGFEGSVNLHKGQAPLQRLASPHSILLVESPLTGLIYTTRFDPEIRPPTAERSRVLDLVDTRAKLEVLGYSRHLRMERELVEDGVFGFASGVAGTLASGSLGQSLPVRLSLQSPESAKFDLFGMAEVEWVDSMPPVAKPRDRRRVVPGEGTYRETQMIFGNQPTLPVLHNTSGLTSGYRFRLVRRPGAVHPDIEMEFPSGQIRRMTLAEARRGPVMGDQAPTEIIVAEYWPDMRMVEGRPVSVSDEPRNPAALVTLSGLIEDIAPQEPKLLLGPGEGEGIAYRLMRGTAVVREGRLEPGQTLATGWNDWAFTLERRFEKARQVTVAREEEGTMGPMVPGILARVVRGDGTVTEAKWIASGSTETFDLGGQAAQVGFGLETKTIPFGISLLDFEVPRFEGTETPSNFISTVRFHGPGGETVDRRIEMNHPGSYPPEWWRQFTGTTYKFSQAGWNAQNLEETTLQVLYDPGWLLKWMGSLMICVGIFVMFYLRPKRTIRP
ncbi:MAG: cytochrome C biogenesis protein ResB [Verrucomicrobiia bacterium]